jgi:hypothetical protein
VTLDAAAEAVRAASRGWAVFPVERAGKRPVAGLKWRDASTCDIATVETWAAAHPDANWGLDLGKSGLLAVDVDTKTKRPDGGYEWTRQGWDDLLALFAVHGEPYPACSALTGNGGAHWILLQPDPPIGGRTQHSRSAPLGRHIDIKSAGGYTLLPGGHVPPAVHHPTATGAYTWGADTDPQPPPPWLVELLTPPPPPPPPDPYRAARSAVLASQGRAGNPQRHLQRIAADLAAATCPGRNDSLNRAAYMLRDDAAALGAPAVVAALRDACRTNGLEHDDGRNACIATAASGLGIPPSTVGALW